MAGNQETQSQIDDLTGARNDLQSQVSDLQGQINSLNSRIADLQAKLATARTFHSDFSFSAQKDGSDFDLSLDTSADLLQAAVNDDAIRGALKKYDQDLPDKVAKVRSDIQAFIDRLANQINDLSNQVSQAQGTLSATQSKLDSTQSQIDGLSSQQTADSPADG